MVIFAANLTLFRALTAWICIQREEFDNFTIFYRIFGCEIYYWLLQNQCFGSRWSHIYRFILVNFKCGEITINLRPWSSWTANSDKKPNVNKPCVTSRKTAFRKFCKIFCQFSRCYKFWYNFKETFC